MKLLLIPLLFLACAVHASGIQKWVDESGQVHYGDSPPSNANAEQIRVSRPPANPGRSLPRLGDNAQDSEEAGQTQADAPPSTAPEIPADEQAQFCAEARQDLRTIERNQRIRLRQADGSTRLMTSEEIQQRREQSQADVDRYCQ